MNQCIHNIDLLRWFMGDDIDEVMAYTDQLEHPYLDAEDLGMALVKFSNGSYGLIALLQQQWFLGGFCFAVVGALLSIIRS